MFVYALTGETQRRHVRVSVFVKWHFVEYRSRLTGETSSDVIRSIIWLEKGLSTGSYVTVEWLAPILWVSKVPSSNLGLSPDLQNCFNFVSIYIWWLGRSITVRWMTGNSFTVTDLCVYNAVSLSVRNYWFYYRKAGACSYRITCR